MPDYATARTLGRTAYGRTTYLIEPKMTVLPLPHQPWYGIGPLGALRRGFQKYATFSGRASRSEFWWFQFDVWLGEAALITAMSAGAAQALDRYAERTGQSASLEDGLELATAEGGGLWILGLGAFFLIGAAAWLVACALPALALTWRRLHDAGYAGAWALFALAPAGGLFLLYWLCRPASPLGSFYDSPRPRRPARAAGLTSGARPRRAG